jgi:transcriptional regulator with GAF, ATPase, and Fis domain
MSDTLPPPPLRASSAAFKAAPPARDYALMMCTRGTVRWFSLERGKDCTIGRGETSDIVIPYEGTSRKHAVIRWRDYPFIEDLQSLNGTFVAGRKLGAREPVRLQEGTAIQIGPVTLVVHATAADPLGLDAQGDPLPILPGMILRDEKMLALYRLVEDVAPSDLSVLIMGETGTGKELLAQLIHERSPNGKGPFVRLNCAALPESLAESELFGHERGSFTGAERNKEGLFEAANGGTLFLDEVGELSLVLQAKLLRVLDKGEVLPVGAVRARRVMIRVVAATNRDLRERVGSGEFRADLFYRLSGVVVNVPPLRDRRDEIPALVESFAMASVSRAGKPLPQFSEDAMSALCAHDWPGNVRELKHVVERVVLLARNGVISPAELGLGAASVWPPLASESAPTMNDHDEFPEVPTSVTLRSASARTDGADNERQRIVDALARTNGNQVRAARLLGVSRRTLINRLDTYGLPRPRKTE